MKILLCGGRDFEDFELFLNTVNPYKPFTMIVGYDPDKDYPHGLDKMAYNYAILNNLPCDCYPYHYHLGNKGGSSRNTEMLEAKPDLCIAFPTKKSKGTWNMIHQCKDKVKTIIIGP